MKHIINTAENIFLIAKRYKVKLGDLIDANPQIPNPESIVAGQVLNIPLSPGYRQSPSAAQNTYVVQKGDTFYKIAQKLGVALNALTAANPQITKLELLHPGQTINIPAAPPAKEVSVSIAVIGYDRVLVPQRTINVTNFDLRPHIENNSQWGPSVLTEPTVAHAVIKALLDARIDFEVEKYGWGLYFSVINGLRQREIRPTSGWLYSVNGNQASVGAQDYKLKGGETIVWRFDLGGH